jgi:hypothetical protein
MTVFASPAVQDIARHRETKSAEGKHDEHRMHGMTKQLDATLHDARASKAHASRIRAYVGAAPCALET